MHETATAAGLTTREVALRLRVSEDKIRLWIRAGELAAINTAASLAGRPRFVVTADSLAEFERRRSGASSRPARRKRRKTGQTDYYPDDGEPAAPVPVTPNGRRRQGVRG